MELSKIQDTVEAIAAAIAVSFIRAEGNGPRPKLPFLRYKEISETRDSDRSVCEEYRAVEGEEKVEKISSSDSVSIVSLNFFNNDYAGVREQATHAWRFIDSDEGQEIFLNLGVVVSKVSPQIADRTEFFNNAFEYRRGFDIRIAAVDQSIETIDSLDLSASIEDMQFHYPD